MLVYDGTNPPLNAAQKLVLALRRPLSVNAAAAIDIVQAGQLQVAKTIAGTGAGFQGEVTLAVDCDDPENAFDRTYTIDAGTPAGTQTQPVLSGIPVGTTCTVTETADGDNGLVNITTPVVIDPAETVIAEGPPAAVSVTNTYDRAFGGLAITKVIAGPGAGQQDVVVLHLDCRDPDNAFDRDFAVAAGLPAGTYPQEVVRGIPAGTTCTVSETATGKNDRVSLLASAKVMPATVVIVDAVTAPVTFTNNYGHNTAKVTHVRFTEQFLAHTGVPIAPGAVGLVAAALILTGSGLVALDRRRGNRRRQQRR